jgi:hypothetical protein
LFDLKRDEIIEGWRKLHKKDEIRSSHTGEDGSCNIAPKRWHVLASPQASKPKRPPFV